jgi:hypothetical protein
MPKPACMKNTKNASDNVCAKDEIISDRSVSQHQLYLSRQTHLVHTSLPSFLESSHLYKYRIAIYVPNYIFFINLLYLVYM